MVDIILKELREADIPVWCGWFNDPVVTEYMNKGVFPNTIESQREFFADLRSSNTDAQFSIRLKQFDYRSHTGLIGTIGIHKIDWVHRRGDVSVLIGDPAYRGRGVATEAIGLIVCHGFLKMNLRKLTAGMWASNVGSIRAFEKNSFVLEGTLKENYHHNVRYVAELRYGLLRPEWEKIQQ